MYQDNLPSAILRTDTAMQKPHKDNIHQCTFWVKEFICYLNLKTKYLYFAAREKLWDPTL